MGNLSSYLGAGLLYEGDRWHVLGFSAFFNETHLYLLLFVHALSYQEEMLSSNSRWHFSHRTFESRETENVVAVSFFLHPWHEKQSL